MAESKVFQLSNELDAEKVGKGIESFLRDKKHLMSESTKTPEGFFVQAKEESNWKKVAGMDMATQVKIMQIDSMITVEVGTGKWVDKIGAGAIGMILFAPLAVTAAVGAFGQKKLPSEIFAFVEQFIMSGGKNATVSMTMNSKSDDSQVTCPSCNSSVEKGVKFCPSCGGKLVVECPNCNAAVGLGVKFCPDCGSSTILKKHCSACNHEVSEEEKFCPECGTSLK